MVDQIIKVVDKAIGQRLKFLFCQAYEWWLNDMYLDNRAALPVNSNPGMVLPKRKFEDEASMLRFLAFFDCSWWYLVLLFFLSKQPMYSSTETLPDSLIPTFKTSVGTNTFVGLCSDDGRETFTKLSINFSQVLFFAGT